MKSVDLNAIPYKLRFNAASLLISKANKLCGLVSMDEGARPDQKALLSAIAYYDMALALQKPYDPNYSTVVNWKCNVLRELGQYEEAVSWYREIIRLSDETNGPEMRDATAKLAEEMIRDCGGRPSEPLAVETSGETDFDDPPYCMFAIEFCELLADQKFKKAHSYLSPTLKERVSLNLNSAVETWV
ncbi:MAG: tetratricopeptide repeat protein [Opitutus sp.]